MKNKQDDRGNQDAGEQKGSALQSLSSGTTQAAFLLSAQQIKCSSSTMQALFSIGRCIYTREKRYSLAMTSQQPHGTVSSSCDSWI